LSLIEVDGLELDGAGFELDLELDGAGLELESTKVTPLSLKAQVHGAAIHLRQRWSPHFARERTEASRRT
jgi:hypothetical protein